MSDVNTGSGVQLPASEEQLTAWEARFRPYRRHPSRDCLIAWLKQFDEEHQTIAHRVLDSVILLSEDDILQGYKGTLESLPGWSKKSDERAWAAGSLSAWVTLARADKPCCGSLERPTDLPPIVGKASA